MPIPLSRRVAETNKPWFGTDLPARVVGLAIEEDLTIGQAAKRLKASLGETRKATQIKKEYDEYTDGRIQLAISRSARW